MIAAGWQLCLAAVLGCSSSIARPSLQSVTDTLPRTSSDAGGESITLPRSRDVIWSGLQTWNSFCMDFGGTLRALLGDPYSYCETTLFSAYRILWEENRTMTRQELPPRGYGGDTEFFSTALDGRVNYARSTQHWSTRGLSRGISRKEAVCFARRMIDEEWASRDVSVWATSYALATDDPPDAQYATAYPEVARYFGRPMNTEGWCEVGLYDGTGTGVLDMNAVHGYTCPKGWLSADAAEFTMPGYRLPGEILGMELRTGTDWGPGGFWGPGDHWWSHISRPVRWGIYRVEGGAALLDGDLNQPIQCVLPVDGKLFSCETHGTWDGPAGGCFPPYPTLGEELRVAGVFALNATAAETALRVAVSGCVGVVESEVPAELAGVLRVAENGTCFTDGCEAGRGRYFVCASPAPTTRPSSAPPTDSPSMVPTTPPFLPPSEAPLHTPTSHPFPQPTAAPVKGPTVRVPTKSPTGHPSPEAAPTAPPSSATVPPSRAPTATPSQGTGTPSRSPSLRTTAPPSAARSVPPSATTPASRGPSSRLVPVSVGAGGAVFVILLVGWCMWSSRTW
eukprot:Hpha_TRINITY_DN19751_c0_g1::TRINITY_DN19751_c0_g1_i1::g.21794::m.21794